MTPNIKVSFSNEAPQELASCTLTQLRVLAKELSSTLSKRKEIARRTNTPAEKVSENDKV